MKKLVLLLLICSTSLGDLKDSKRAILRITEVFVDVSKTERYGGTGFFIQTPSNRIITLTNEHICKDSKNGTVEVVELSGRTTAGKILKMDHKSDLCAIDTSHDSGFTLANSVKCNESGFTGGHPHLGPISGGWGCVCDHVFFYKVFPGMSGSPVFTKDLKLIGVVKEYYTDPQYPLGFIVTISEIKEFLKGL